ncbi:VWA domain-containing protein [Marinobacter sp. CHS3-4]|uniref:VWA domain-containing protein n=1 Tax=Marinobacter sp. CHS3-4 TaxID=3045174 RepID=UPI0024B5F2E3|nr:VWA domain-containing protein [Marinobacter sp. CHS3-4]MDI9245376.1 VWA domain-containing protein [Marinobacter sp. CHS3-4]
MHLTTALKFLLTSLFSLSLIACGGGDDGGSPSAQTFSITGTLAGATGMVTLQYDGSENLTVSDNSEFTIMASVADGTSYNITVLTEPTGQTCTVTNGSGSISGADVSNILINCETNSSPKVSVGGSVSGLSGTLILQNNGADDLIVSADGNFTFSAELNDGAGYSVSIASQPSDQICILANESGSVSSADVTDVSVSCSTLSNFSVSGSVSDLTNGSYTLALNGSAMVTINAGDTSFNFTETLLDGDGYVVSIDSQSSTDTCSLSNATGTVSNADVANVQLTCLGSDGFTLTDYGISQEAPSVVVGSLRVTDLGSGLPLSDLAGGDFIVLENGTAVNPLESFVDAEQVGDANLALQSVLILDISTSLLPADIVALKDAAKAVVAAKPDNQEIAIFTFDSAVTQVQTFSSNNSVLNAAIDTIPESLLERGNSTNLYGAVVTAMDRVNNFFRLDNAQFGYGILISDGEDTSGLATEGQAQAAVAGKDLFAISIGELVDVRTLAALTGSSDRIASAADTSELSAQLAQVQADALAQTQGLYRVYYATPKRSGTHTVSISLADDRGCLSSVEGCVDSISGTFDATGFTDIVPEVLLRVPEAAQPADLLQPVVADTVLTINARLRWINVTPNFEFQLVDVVGGTPTLTAIDADTQSLTIPADFNQATVEVLDTVTGLSASMTFEYDFGINRIPEYLKPSATDANDTFGSSLAISADGTTLAVGASREDSSATGAYGNPADNSASNSGAVYVFTRDDAGEWLAPAYIKASNTDALDQFGYSVTLSADGDTLAVGAPRELSTATGVNGDESINASGSEALGAVYIFNRIGGIWSQQAYVKASSGRPLFFGESVALSSDGTTLAIGGSEEESGSTGVNGDDTNNLAPDSGAVWVFTLENSVWSQQAYVKASNTDSQDFFGRELSLSADGNILAVAASGEDSGAVLVNGDQNNIDAPDSGAVYVFSRDGETWTQEAYIKASNTDPSDRFGVDLSLSGDGKTLAVGAAFEKSSSTGVNGDQFNNDLYGSGAVYMFNRVGGIWSDQAYIKASTTNSRQFGLNVALSADGKSLAVGARDNSSSIGLNGDQLDSSASGSGAVYLFRLTDGAWSQNVYVKASNTEEGDFFGTAESDVVLSANGGVLAVSANREDSNATGINGDQSDNSASNAGSVYLY